MTVLDLRMILSKYDDDCLVVLSKDKEGNGYSPAYKVDGTTYVSDATRSGTLLDDDEILDEDGEHGVDAVVIWPVN
jgi:hypothetical protein